MSHSYGFSVNGNSKRRVFEVLDHFGGHTLAAGVGLNSQNIDAFRREINSFAATLEPTYPVLNIDCKLNPVAINGDLLNALSTLEPFGAGNTVPVFGLYSMNIDGVQAVSEGRHIRLMLSKGDAKISAMRFGVSPIDFPFKKGDTIDIAVTVEANEYLGEIRPSVHVKAVRGSGMNDKKVLDGIALYEKVMRRELLTQSEKTSAAFSKTPLFIPAPLKKTFLWENPAQPMRRFLKQQKSPNFPILFPDLKKVLSTSSINPEKTFPADKNSVFPSQERL